MLSPFFSVRSGLKTALVLLASTNALTVLAQSATRDELEGLRNQVAAQQEQMAAQQKQIDELRRILQEQSKLLAAVTGKSVETPIRQAEHFVAAAEPTPNSQKTAKVAEQAAPRMPTQGTDAPRSPLSIGVGPLVLTPTGFVDYAQVWRSKTVSSGLPTNFASIPFRNTVEGNRRQTLSSAANTRLGLQLNAKISGLQFLGIVESDFLGFQPGNISTTTNSYGLRMRLAFADVHTGKWEFLGGQDWSMLTPGRTGISASPGGLFLTQDLDPNIQSGLVWTRSPQFRIVHRPKHGVALGISFESGETYVGGSGGAGTITLPNALAPDYFNQVNTGGSGLSVPSPHLDAIGKIAFDWTHWGHTSHLEIAGLMSQFAFYNPLTNQHFSVVGGGASANAVIEVARRLSVLSANFYSDGGGRFIYGEAPALIIDGNGAPSLLHAMSTLDGVEYQTGPSWRLWAYFGGTYIGRNVAIDPSNGGIVGYGYTGSPNNQNRSIQEVTTGFTHVIRQDPVFGTLQFSGQYSWLVRHPWYVASGEPAAANLNMLYLGVRYLLPAPPAVGK
jgi:hypothetical protein